MEKTSQQSLGSDVSESVVTAGGGAPPVFCLEERFLPEGPPMMDSLNGPAVMLLAPPDGLAPVSRSTPRVGVTYHIPDLTNWLPDSPAPEMGQAGLALDPGAPAGDGSLSLHCEAARTYTIQRVSGSVEAADEWLRTLHPDRLRCLLILGEYSDVMDELPEEVQRTSVLAELWRGDEALQRVYVVMSTITPADSLGFILVGPPSRASRAA